MECITPVRAYLTDRFPVATFVVRVPPERCFEIVCATHPNLFLPENGSQRTQKNFYTTRQEGLLRAPRGEVNYIIPGNQLQRFAGSQRLYYGLATYGDPTGKNARLSINRAGINHVPFIRLSNDFTGQCGSRPSIHHEFSPVDKTQTYGGRKSVLTWGGDMHYNSASPGKGADEYDDGYDTSLWKKKQETLLPSPSSNQDDVQDDYSYVQQKTDSVKSSENDEYADASDMTSRNGHYEIASYPGRENVQSQGTYSGDAVHESRYGTFTPAAGNIGEPEGYEDGRQLRQYGGVPSTEIISHSNDEHAKPQETYGGYSMSESHYGPSLTAGGIAEPDGYEDAWQLKCNGGVSRQLNSETVAKDYGGYGSDKGPSLRGSAGTTVANASVYCEEEQQLRSHGLETPPSPKRRETPMVLSLSDTFQKVIVPIASFESGLQSKYFEDREKYHNQIASAYAKTVLHPITGLSFGILQFKQAGPTLGKVLTACGNRNDQLCRTIFGEHWDALLKTTNAADPQRRLEAVGGAALGDIFWRERFAEVGKNPLFWPAQNEVALTWYFDRNKSLMRLMGLNTDRAMTIFCDRCVQMGNAGGSQWILETISPLINPDRINSALAAVGFTDMASFQKTKNIPVTEELDIRTHAELLNALRTIQSEVTIPGREEILDRLVSAAFTQNQPWRQRIEALRNDTANFTDQVFQLE